MENIINAANAVNQPQVFFLMLLSLGDVAPPQVPCMQKVKIQVNAEVNGQNLIAMRLLFLFFFYRKNRLEINIKSDFVFF